MVTDTCRYSSVDLIPIIKSCQDELGIKYPPEYLQMLVTTLIYLLFVTMIPLYLVLTSFLVISWLSPLILWLFTKILKTAPTCIASFNHKGQFTIGNHLRFKLLGSQKVKKFPKTCYSVMTPVVLTLYQMKADTPGSVVRPILHL